MRSSHPWGKIYFTAIFLMAVIQVIILFPILYIYFFVSILQNISSDVAETTGGEFLQYVHVSLANGWEMTDWTVDTAQQRLVKQTELELCSKGIPTWFIQLLYSYQQKAVHGIVWCVHNIAWEIIWETNCRDLASYKMQCVLERNFWHKTTIITWVFHLPFLDKKSEKSKVEIP